MLFLKLFQSNLSIFSYVSSGHLEFLFKLPVQTLYPTCHLTTSIFYFGIGGNSKPGLLTCYQCQILFPVLLSVNFIFYSSCFILPMSKVFPFLSDFWVSFLAWKEMLILHLVNIFIIFQNIFLI